MNSLLRAVALVSVTVAHGSAQVGRPQARVVSTTGAWTNQDRLLIRGARPEIGTSIDATNAAELLVECGDAGHFRYACSAGCQVQVCEAPPAGVTRTRVDVERGFFDSLIRREPRELVVAAARAGGNLSDAVLVQDARGVHLGPAFNRVLEGRYCVQLASLGTGSADPPSTLTVEWDRAVDAEGIAQSDARPGLYRAEKGTPGADGACALDSDGVPAWVLLTPADQLASVNAKWKEYQQSAGELERANAAPSIVATFRHGALASLADSQAAR